MATTAAVGTLDELLALHDELGIFRAPDELGVERQRAGVSDELLLRTLAVLPVASEPSLSGAVTVLFGEPHPLRGYPAAGVGMGAGTDQGRRQRAAPASGWETTGI